MAYLKAIGRAIQLQAVAAIRSAPISVRVPFLIVKTIAIDLTFTSLGLLAGLVPVRIFLSWTLVLEIEGRWPWQRQLLPAE